MLEAVIFDLDGVIADSAEFHFLAWQQTAQEIGITFTREDNEQLRGVSRRDSLLFILKLGGQTVAEDKLQRLMAHKNELYTAMLTDLQPDDALPGVLPLLAELDAAEIPYALGSASRNAVIVLEKLQIFERFQFIADGNAPGKKKPAPDVFLFAAQGLNIEPTRCLVIEDAAKGVQAAQAAGMAALAVGDAARFGDLLADARTGLRPNLAGVTLADLRALATGQEEKN